MSNNTEDHVLLQALRVDALYCNAFTPMLSLLFGALSIIIYFWGVDNVYPMLYWFTVLCVIAAIRCLIIFKYKTYQIAPEEYPFWLSIYKFGLMITGIVWGSAVYILPVENNYIDIGVLTMLILVVISASTGIYSVFNRVYYCLSMPMIAPLIYFLITHESEQLHKMGLIVSLYTGLYL